MTNKEAIKFLKQLYPNGGHCWLDEQRIEAIGMAVKSLQEEHISTRDKLRALSDGKQHLGWLDDAREVEEEPVSDIEAYQSRWGKSIGFINKSTSDEIGDYDHKAVMESLHPELKEEPVSEELEEAAFDYAEACKYDGGEKLLCVEHFKAGANWQKEKVMANTADATIGLPYENKDGGYTHLVDVSRPLPVGDNKIAIIFKED